MRALCALLVLLPAVAFAQDASYFPLREGNTWVFGSKVKVRVKLGPFKVKKRVKTPLRVTAVCGAPKRIEGRIYYPITWTDNTGALNAKVWVRTAGTKIIIHRAIGSRLLLLPGDLSQSTGVDLDFGFGGKKVALRDHRVGAPVPFTVPAGTFTAIPIDGKLQLNQFKGRTRVAYGQGVGPIWIEEELNVSGKKTGHTLVLKYFKAGTGPAVPPPPMPSTPQPPAPRPPVSEPPPPQPHVSEPPPVRVAPTQAPPLALISSLVANPQPELWRELEQLTQQLLARSKRLGFSPPLADLPVPQLMGRGLSSRIVVDGTLLISDGSIDTRGLDESFVFVNGDVTIKGNVLDAVVLCTGKLTVTGTIKNSLVLASGEVRTRGYVKASLFQAKQVTASGNSIRCLYVATTAKVRQSTGDRSAKGPGPLDLFRGR